MEAEQQGRAPCVDSHAHIYHDGMPLAADAWHRPEGEARLGSYLACLDRAGIARAVLAAISLFGENNDYALAATAAQPRLRTTVIVDPAIDIGALRDMAAAGAVGVRLQWRSTPEPPDLASPIWAGMCNCTTMAAGSPRRSRQSNPMGCRW